jgi:alpha-L-rhamnosidase
MLDYGMLWVQSVHEYWRRTGDVKLLTQIYPVATDFVEYLQQYKHPVTGLLDIPIDHWSKTVYLDTSVYYDRYGQSTAVNALYYDTLLDIADISEQLGDSSSASTLRQEASVVRTHVNKYLYIETEGRYAGSLLQDATLEPSPHAQAWALAYDLVPDDQIQRVADAMLELLSSNPAEPNVQIYGMFWTLEALSRADRHHDAVKIIDRYYGRLLDLGATTWWEHFNAHELYWSSLSHGWGGSPTWFLTTHILGVQRTGVNTWFVQPGLSGVEFAEGALPLADGTLEVRWNRPDCSQIELEVVAPRTTSGEVLIPLTDDSLMITLNEIPVWQDGIPLVDRVVAHQEGVLLSLSGGQHSFNIERACYSMYLPVIQR